MTPKERIEKWQAYIASVEARAKALDEAIHDRGWALAASVGIPRDGCCLHNASIDDDLKGWCNMNPHRLKVAKEANYLVGQWPASNLARKIVMRSWNRMVASPQGWAQYNVDKD